MRLFTNLLRKDISPLFRISARLLIRLYLCQDCAKLPNQCYSVGPSNFGSLDRNNKVVQPNILYSLISLSLWLCKPRICFVVLQRDKITFKNAVFWTHHRKSSQRNCIYVELSKQRHCSKQCKYVNSERKAVL